MAALRRKVIVNLPYFLNSLLHEIAIRFKISKDQALVVSHYMLIKLIVVRGLNKASIEDFGNTPLNNEHPEMSEEAN